MLSAMTGGPGEAGGRAPLPAGIGKLGNEMQQPSIDCHAHVFHRGLRLAPDRRYAPDYDAPLESYLQELDRHGMTHGVLVQPSFLGTDNSYLVESLTAGRDRLRGIAMVDGATSPPEYDVLDRAGVVGIRLNLIGRSLPDFAELAWRKLLSAVRHLDWHVELQRNASGLVPLVPQLLDRGVTVVLDHFGLPDPSLGIRDPGFVSLLELGRSQMVFMKMSAAYRNGADGRAFAREAYPLLREAFGLGRLLWGSDWPHTQFEAKETYESNRQFLDQLIADQQERAQVLGAPRTLYRF